MQKTLSPHSPTNDVNKRVSWWRWLIAAFLMLVFPAVILFCSSGHLNWGMAWVYIGLTTFFAIGSRIIMLQKTPELLAERGQALNKKDTEPWDKTIMPLVAIVGPTVILIAAGLDERFGWSPELSKAVHIAAFVITVLAYILGVWSTVVNKYFSAVVRIQQDRGQTVVTSGPYRYVRHPGYSGGIVTNFTIPLLLGSLWALAPGLLVNGLIVIRTVLEDNTLKDKLDGYRDYARRVRYRLIPGVW
ncbi:MAG: isoprenylcysteine carboxylmethyltransferase family protein [Candidatus Aminicenantes bacterium]|nr:isoprenylcysteine carboxylmethyltransferase family protein [Candidatus Aminicenantes bacterium]